MSLKVVFLDDEPILCECFSDEFSSANVEITTYSDVNKAIEAVTANPPDLVFLDYRMPTLTGDLAAKKMPDTVPKFLVTGELDLKTDYPFVEILKKPFQYEKIQEIIDKALSQK